MPCNDCGKKATTPRTATPATAAVRPSCPECVEKHLGDALVLFDEYRSGYTGHVDFIRDHLTAAEEIFSEDWPERFRSRVGHLQCRRLRIIGNLNQAEQESRQRFPGLADAIRDARREYQNSGRVPNFGRLYDRFLNSVKSGAGSAPDAPPPDGASPAPV